MNENEHSNSEFFYPDKLQFQENSESTIELTDRDRVGRKQPEKAKNKTIHQSKKSKNTTKKTVSGMKFFRFFSTSFVVNKKGKR